MPESFAIILLAAGSSSRMGAPKQLLDFGGKPLLRHAAVAAILSGPSRVAVVLGAGAEALRPALAGLDVDIVLNERWSEGMGTSIRSGLQVLAGSRVSGAILALADQPFVTARYLRDLATRHQETSVPIIASRYDGTAGVPAFFHRDVFPALFTLQPSQGCKGIILGSEFQVVLVDCPEAAIDVDTQEDYVRALSLGAGDAR